MHGSWYFESSIYSIPFVDSAYTEKIDISLILAFCDNVLYPDFARLSIGGDLCASHLSH